MDAKKFQALKEEVEEARSEAARAQGARAQLVKQLMGDFKVGSIEAARDLLEDLEKERDKAERDFDRALKEYERKWKG